MAKKSQQEFVQHITPRDVDFSQWYTDVVRLADLMDYTPVRGCMAIKPYGYGIWELIQQQLDAEFKRTGHQNVSDVYKRQTTARMATRDAICICTLCRSTRMSLRGAA